MNGIARGNLPAVIAGHERSKSAMASPLSFCPDRGGVDGTELKPVGGKDGIA